MALHKARSSLITALILASAAVPATSAARAVDSETLAPGTVRQHICTSPYRSAAKLVPVSINGEPLEVRKVHRTVNGQRVVFTHRVQVFDQLHRRFRLVVNRGRNTVVLTDECNAGA